MDTSPLTTRRQASTLAIALLPVILGLSIYSFWLYEYFINYNISPLSGMIPIIGFGLLVVAVPANFLGLIFLYLPYKKNKKIIDENSKLKNKFRALFAILLLNYFIAGGIIYNYHWLSSTVSIELTHNYNKPLREIRIVLPNGDGPYMNIVAPGQTGFARVFAKGEGPVELMITDSEQTKIRVPIVKYVTKSHGARVKLTLEPDFSLKIQSGLKN